MNKVVARYVNGEMVKGVTADFFPGRETFHVSVVPAAPGTDTVEIRMKDLKAIFFVKDFTGNPHHARNQEFDASRLSVGHRIKVVFKDGEVFVGTTQGYRPGRQGFFVVPADPDLNTERCYVMSSATQAVSFL
jgi:hypothetical protein